MFSEERRQKLRDAHSGKNNFNIRPVYCPELDQEFWGAKEAHDLFHDAYKVRSNGICACCKGEQTYCGKLPDGTRLHWCYLEDKDSFVIPIENRESPVFCIELDEVFLNACVAANDERILKAHSTNIYLCCKGHQHHKTCGVLFNGTRLTWRYATSDEIQQLYKVAI